MCVALGVSGAAVSAQQDVSEVVRTALTTNPDVTEARNRWLARREEVRQAEGGYYPTVDVNAGFGYEYTDSPSTRAVVGGSTLFPYTTLFRSDRKSVV